MLKQKDVEDILVKMSHYSGNPYKKILRAIQLQENNNNIPWLTRERFKDELAIVLDEFVHTDKSVYSSQQIDILVADVLDETIIDNDYTGWVEEKTLQSLRNSVIKAMKL